MKRKLMILFICLVFVVSLLPATGVLAANCTVRVAEMTIQDGYYTLVGSQWTKYTGDDIPEAPYFHYDSANHILTLNNVTIDPSNDGIGTFPLDGSTSPEIYISYSGGTFTIELIGENKIIDNPEANPRQWKRGPAIEVL